MLKNRCFWTVVLEKTLESPWTARRSNQSILKEISPEYSLEGLILKLKLQYFGQLMPRTDSFEKTLVLERLKVRGEGNDRRWDGWMASPTQWTWVWVNSGSWWWTGRPGVLQFMGLQRVGHDWATELNWTELNRYSHPSKDAQVILYSFLFPTLYVVAINWISWICPLFCYCAFIIFYLETSIAS